MTRSDPQIDRFAFAPRRDRWSAGSGSPAVPDSVDNKLPAVGDAAFEDVGVDSATGRGPSRGGRIPRMVLPRRGPVTYPSFVSLPLSKSM